MSNGIGVAAKLQQRFNEAYADAAIREGCCSGWAVLPLGPDLPDALAAYAEQTLGGITREEEEFIKSCSPHQLGLLRLTILQGLNCPLPEGPGLGEEVGLMQTKFVGGYTDPMGRPTLVITVTADAKAFVALA